MLYPVRSVSLVMPFVVLLAGLACERRQPEEWTRFSDSSGIVIARTRVSDQPLGWRLERIGSLAGIDLAGAPQGPRELLAVGSDGSIHVLDALRGQVRAFGADGEDRGIYGSPGEGPGELLTPVNIFRGRGDTIAVFDVGKRRLVRFDGDGVSVPSPPGGISYTGPRIRSLDAGLAYNSFRFEDAPTMSLILSAGGHPRTLISHTQPRTRVVELAGCPAPISRGPLFSPKLVWNANDKRLVAGVGSEYAIWVFESGAPVLRIERDVLPVEVSEGIVRDELGVGTQMVTPLGRCHIPADMIRREFGYSEHLPFFDEVIVSPLGRVWIQRPQGFGKFLVDVFERNGEYLGTLPPGTPFPAAFTDANGREVVVVITEAELGSKNLVLFELVRSGVP